MKFVFIIIAVLVIISLISKEKPKKSKGILKGPATSKGPEPQKKSDK